MDDKEIILNALGNINGSQSTPVLPTVNLGQLLAQLKHISGYLQHLEQGIVKLSAEVQRSSLMNEMFAKILIARGVITEEELQTVYQNEVYAPMKASNDEMQEKIKAAVEEAQAAQAARSSQCACAAHDEDETDSETDDSTVVLASERFKRS
jgi:hypothetical protein